MSMRITHILLMAALWCLSIFSPCTVSAQESVDFGQLRTMIDSGLTEVEDDLYITGLVISDYGNKNLELNNNRHYSTVITRNTDRCAYIESLDGRYGFKLVFQADDDSRLMRRYSRVSLNLKGSVLSVDEPRRYTISRLTAGNVAEVKDGFPEDLPQKVKSVSELTDEDFYTFVTLRDCEFAFKDGSYTNIYETYSMRSELNKVASPNNSMDGWAALLHNNRAQPIYMLVNTRCQWRRTGKGVPQGTGLLSGIVVHAVMPRYGGDVMGRYSIRPLDERDIALSWEGASSFRTIAEWNWNDGAETFRTERGNMKTVRTEKIKADVGEGLLSVTSKGTVTRVYEFNNPSIEKEATSWGRGQRGMRRNGAMRIKTEACNWWNWEDDCGEAVVMELNTTGLAGRNLFMAFSFAAGDLNAQTSYAFPVYWCVEYSLDGVRFARLKTPEIVLRSSPWWWVNDINGNSHVTSYEAGMGFTEHIVKLPAGLLGREKIVLRIKPMSKNVATLALEQTDRGANRPNLTTMTYVNFGTISVRYN